MLMTLTTICKRWQPYLILAAATLVCHGPLLLCDYLIWDDLWVIDWIENGDLDYVYQHCWEVGHVYYYYHYVIISVLPHLATVMKIAGFVLTFVGAVVVYHLLARVGAFAPFESVLVSMITIAFPAFKLRGTVGNSSGYMWPPILFYIAVLLAFKAEEYSGFRHWVLRLFTLLCFTCTFCMNSMLMYYGGFFVVLVVMEQRRLGWAVTSIPWTFILRRLDYVLIPFAFYAWKLVFSPTHGPHFGDYNRPSFDLAIIVAGYTTLFREGIAAPFLYFHLPLFTSRWAFICLAGAFLIAGIWSNGRVNYVQFLENRISRTPLLSFWAFAFLALLLATLPYVMINKPPTAWGLSTNYSVLMPLPVALVMLAFLRSMRWFRHGMLVAGPVLCVVFCQFACNWWDNYLSLQALQVRNDSMIGHFRQCPQAKECSVVWIKMDGVIPKTPDGLHGWLWTYTAKEATGGARSIGMAAPNLPRESASPEVIEKAIFNTALSYALTDIDPSGKQITLMLRSRGILRNPHRAACQYLFYRTFAPHLLPGFLDTLTSIDVNTIPTR